MSFAPGILLAVSLTSASLGCRATTSSTTVAFVGDWKMNPSRSKAIDMMRVQSLGGEAYGLDFGGGTVENIAADGVDHPGIQGTTFSITVDGADSWHVVRKKDGHVLISAMWKLSPDTNTLTDDYSELAPDGTVSLQVRYVYQRTAPGAGFAGTWEMPLPSDGLPHSVIQIRVFEANGLSFIYPAQDVTRSLRFDGKEYPMQGRGAADGTTSSGRRIGEHTLEVTDKRDGQLRKTEEIELSPDKKTLTKTSHPAGQRGVNILVFERQAAPARS